MADMYGAVRANEFKVKDVDAFVSWFTENVFFGDSIEVWTDDDNTVSFGGYEQYPNAYPQIPGKYVPFVDEDGNEEEIYEDSEEWDLEAFAVEVRKHLQDGEEFRVLAVGNEKLCYTNATHLVITSTYVNFTNLYEGN